MQTATENDEGLLITGFTLGTASFGIDAKSVQEVVKVGVLTPVHGAPAGVAGIRNLRGRIVTVIDMARHLGLGVVEVGTDTRLLIIENQGESYGFLVDDLTDTMALDRKQIDAPPVSLDPALRNRIMGVWRDASRLTAILDLQTLFQWEEITS
jgi:purine-binding chemotaxis protein CheW